MADEIFFIQGSTSFGAPPRMKQKRFIRATYLKYSFFIGSHCFPYGAPVIYLVIHNASLPTEKNRYSDSIRLVNIIEYNKELHTATRSISMLNRFNTDAWRFYIIFT